MEVLGREGSDKILLMIVNRELILKKYIEYGLMEWCSFM